MNKQYIYSICFLLAIYMYILSITWLSPLFADDYFYYYHWGNGEAISGFPDILTSQYHHYLTWGGRSIAHTFVQGFLYLGKVSFPFINAFIFVALLLLIFWHSQGRNISVSSHPYILACIALLVWLLLPRFGETVIWLTGACNYLWTTVLILFFLLPYSLKFSGYRVFGKLPVSLPAVGMFLGGIICGWTNENTALTMLLAICLSIYYFYKHNTLEPWMISGLVGAVIGYMLLVLAPGNYVRLAANHADYSFFHHNVLPGLKMILRLTEYQIPIWILLFFFFRILRRNTDNYNFKAVVFKFGNDFIYGVTWIGLALFNNIVMLASPEFPQRAGFSSAIFLIIGVVSFFKLEIIRDTILVARGKKIIIAIVCFVMIPTAFLVFNQYMTLHAENQERENMITLNKMRGIDNLHVTPFSVNTKIFWGHVYISDITSDPNEWKNKGYAKYWGLETIKLTDDELPK